MPSFSIPAAVGADVAADTAAATAVAEGIADVAATGEAVAGVGATAATAASAISPWLAYGGIASGVLGAGTSALGALSTAEAQKNQALYQAQVAENNRQIAGQQAQQAEAAGSAAAEQGALKTRATLGAIKSAEAASNVDVNTGSNVDVRSSAAELGELDALTIRSNYARQAYGYETNATSFSGQAGLETSIAAQAPVAGALSAGGSLLSGASGAARQYAAWQQAGTGTVALFG